jgi:hypothetical protein
LILLNFKDGTELQENIVFNSAKNGDQFEIAKILTIILINCVYKKEKLVCDSIKKLSDVHKSIINYITRRIELNNKLIRNAQFFDAVLKDSYKGMVIFLLFSYFFFKFDWIDFLIFN